MGRRAIGLTAIAAPLGIIGYVVALTFYPDGTEFANPFISFVGGLFLGLLIGVIVFAIRDADAPRRAQAAYISRTGRVPLTTRQQQILALDASSDFSYRGWNSSLAFAPTFAELPDELRRRHNDGQDGSPWTSLPVLSLQTYRAALDEQFKIASSTDAEVLAADALAIGLLSRQFAEVAAGEHGERMMTRVAALSGVQVFDLLELAQGAGDAPARFLLAGDIERSIGGIRYAYVSGYLTAEQTWRLLEPIAERAFRTYTSWDTYWREVTIATAFRTDSLDAVQRQRDNLTQLKASQWPAAALPYPG